MHQPPGKPAFYRDKPAAAQLAARTGKGFQAAIGSSGNRICQGKKGFLGCAFRIKVHHRNAFVSRNHCCGIQRHRAEELEPVALGQLFTAALLKRSIS